MKKRDGMYYFEAVEALSSVHFGREHEAQFLAPCPMKGANSGAEEPPQSDREAVE